MAMRYRRRGAAAGELRFSAFPAKSLESIGMEIKL
jgi:hypothetical protein